MMRRKLDIFLRKSLLLPHQDFFLSKVFEMVTRNWRAWSKENRKLNNLHMAIFLQSTKRALNF